MRSLSRACGLTALILAVGYAPLGAQRKWQPGIWRDSQDSRTYIIQTEAYRLHVEDLTPGDRRALDVPANTAVKVAIEADKVFVLQGTNQERELKLLRRVDLNYSAVGGGHYIKAVGEGGASVTLEDGSIWEIDTRAHVFTVLWQPLEGITIRKIDPERGFNYEIADTDQDNTTLARYNPN